MIVLPIWFGIFINAFTIKIILIEPKFARGMMFIFQGSLPIYSSKVAVSVVDNVLLVHQVDAKVVILYDLFADSRAPISAPLPLLLRGYPRAGMGSCGLPSKGNGSSESKQASDHEMTLYKDAWSFLIPDLICDSTDGLLWKIHLDLDVSFFSSSSSSS